MSAHPRSRGEHLVSKAGAVAPGGSSPLARGTYFYTGGLSLFKRLIPARAGNISLGLGHIHSFTAHPRSRGEHHPFPAGWVSPVGSSPLARGTYPKEGPRHMLSRLIPARAGNILSRIMPLPA